MIPLSYDDPITSSHLITSSCHLIHGLKMPYLITSSTRPQVKEIDMRLHAMPAKKKQNAALATGVECSRAGFDTSGTMEDGFVTTPASQRSLSVIKCH